MPSRSDRIVSLMFQTHRVIHQQVKSGASRDFFSFLKLRILRYVAETGTPSMKELAAYLHVAPPSATDIVEKLVHKKLLARTADTKDRRTVRLAITLKGKKTLEEGFRKVATRMKSVFAALNEREQKNLIEILEKILITYSPSVKRKPK